MTARDGHRPAGLPVIIDATPLVGGHGVRGIGTSVRGILEGFRALPSTDRPVALAAGAPVPGFASLVIPDGRWPLRRLNVPNPLPTARARRALRHRPGYLFHATHPHIAGPNGVPRIEMCHDVIPLNFPDLLAGPRHTLERADFRAYVRRLRSADRVIVTTRAMADDVALLAGVDRERVRVIPLGAAPVSGEPVDAADPPYVLYSGAVEPHKNVEVAIRALAAVRARGLRLVLTGPWSRRRVQALRALAVAEGVSDRVDFRGLVGREELERLRAAATAVLVPSRIEGFGLPAIEAMAVGVPVVTSTARALTEITGGLATQVDPDAPEDWAAVLDGLVENTSARHSARTAGRAHARAFTWKRNAEATLAVYRELL